MTQYFVKYLPVEGPIKPPCVVIERLTTGRYEAFQVDNENDIDLATQRLAKLFLCSNDVKPEDYLNESNPVHVYHDGSEPPFKVVARVSPWVKWLKEFDRLYQSQIRLTHAGENHLYLNTIEQAAAKGWLQHTESLFASIENPSCGHFH